MRKTLIRNGKVVLPAKESGASTEFTIMNRDILISGSVIEKIAPPFSIDPNGNGTPILATDRYVIPGIIKTGVRIDQSSDLRALTQSAVESGITSMQFITKEHSTVRSLEKWMDIAREVSSTNYSFFPVLKDAGFTTSDLLLFDPEFYPGLFVTGGALSNPLKMKWVLSNIRGFPIAVDCYEYNTRLHQFAQLLEVDLQVVPKNLEVFRYSELQAVLQKFQNKELPLEQIVMQNSLIPAINSEIGLRGLIKEGYRADLVLFKMNEKAAVHANKMTYTQGWNSPEALYNAEIVDVLVNGNLSLHDGKFCKHEKHGEKLVFLR